jgi:hypothetical protein
MFRYRFLLVLTAVVLISICRPLRLSGIVQAKEPAQPLLRSSHPFLALQSTPAPEHPPKPADQLPVGDGRDLTARVCTGCHSVDTFSKKRYSEDKWDSVIQDMVSKGLTASDDDLETTSKYLDTYMTPPPDGKPSADPSSTTPAPPPGN